MPCSQGQLFSHRNQGVRSWEQCWGFPCSSALPTVLHN